MFRAPIDYRETILATTSLVLVGFLALVGHAQDVFGVSSSESSARARLVYNDLAYGQEFPPILSLLEGSLFGVLGLMVGLLSFVMVSKRRLRVAAYLILLAVTCIAIHALLKLQLP